MGKVGTPPDEGTAMKVIASVWYEFHPDEPLPKELEAYVNYGADDGLPITPLGEADRAVLRFSILPDR